MLKESKPSVLGKNIAHTLRIAIVRSLFNSEMTDNLEEFCRQTLLQEGVKKENIFSVTVPGALEIPIAADALARTKKYDALIALGVILKGSTYHFEIVANESARGCMEVSLKHGIPVICQIIAAYTIEQARERTGENTFNKGIEAAHGAIAIASTLSAILKKHG